MASAYPGGLDTFAINKADGTATPTDHPTHHNDLADAVNKIEAELGINPSGGSATVAARFTAGASPYLVDPGLKPPASPGTGDIEFAAHANGTAPTAGPGLSWANQGSASAAVNNGRLVFNSFTTTGLRALLKATPGAGNFTIATRAAASRWTNSQFAGLVFLWGTIATPTQIETAGTYANSAVPRIVWSTYGADYTADSDRSAINAGGWVQNPTYSLVTWNGTDLIHAVSPSGAVGTFETVFTATLGFGRPDFIGLGVNTNGSAVAVKAEFAFVRFGWSASDFDPTV